MCRFWQGMCYKSCLVLESLSWQTMKTFCTLTFLPIWSLSLSPDACKHIQSILKDSLGKKCIWTTLHLILRCVLFQCYLKCLISIGRIIVNHWFGLFFFNVYIMHVLGFCEKIIVAGDAVKESLILELCGDRSMFTLLKIKSSYEYLQDMITESR